MLSVLTIVASPLVISSAVSEIQALSSQLNPPSNIIAELSGVPPEVVAAITDPASLSAVDAEFKTGRPSWFTALPSDAQAYIISVKSDLSAIASLESVAGISAGPGATGTAV